MDKLTERERATLAAMEADLAKPAAPPLLDQIVNATPTVVVDDTKADVRRHPQYRAVRPARTDNGGGGFPPIDPPEPTYGGRRPGGGGGASHDISPWTLTFLIWAMVAAAYVVDAPEQRAADRPLMLLVLGFGTVGAFLFGRR